MATESAPLPSTRNIAWMVIVSLLGAVVLALLLTLFVVAGADEHVITATVLFAFAVGAGLLGVLSARWSEQPQRWARIVAGWLASAGAALLFWPRLVATAAMAWVAPALLLALGLWMAVRIRRELNSWVRPWIMYQVVAFVLCAAMAGGYETVRETIDRGVHPKGGLLIEMGDGRRMYLKCAGSGAPTVVLVPGAGEVSSVWGWIAPEVARDTRVCVYDRAGRGWSDPAPGAQDGVALATDLHELLARAGERPPYVLVGHSFGGLYVRAFAARYPDQTGGVVLLDATHPEMFTRLPQYPGFYDVFRRVSALFPSLARFGVARLANHLQSDSLPAEAGAEEVIFWSTARHARSQREEWAAAPVAMRQAGVLVTLADRPLVVVTALKGAQVGWVPLQDELVGLSTNSRHWSVPQASHSELVRTEAGAAVASGAIREAVMMVRSSAHLLLGRGAQNVTTIVPAPRPVPAASIASAARTTG